MRPDPRVLLADVVHAIADIASFSEGLNRQTYIGGTRTQAAVERKFEIGGEALNQLRRTCPEIAERIPPLREVVDFRNMLIHGYGTVTPDRVWDYAENYLPDLRNKERAWQGLTITPSEPEPVG